MEHDILAHEKQFFSAAFCRDTANLESALAPEFQEVGRSGRTLGRRDVIDQLSKLEFDRAIEISDFEVERISANSYLARYMAVDRDRGAKSFRTSRWERRNDRLVLVSHRGERIAPESETKNPAPRTAQNRIP